MDPILPSGVPPAASPPPARSGERWSPDHHRLHRHLLRQPTLLPQGARLLVAVSGGQDSMALVLLLQDLCPLHHWELRLWHGDHGWHPGAAAAAAALTQWAQGTGWTIEVDRAEPRANQAVGEAGARRWRYAALLERARQLGCSHVVTGHTATDRAETLLQNLARGSHRRGLGSLRASRPLAERHLVRPLLLFNRQDTARIVQRWNLPLWLDPSNDDLHFQRNRLRREVIPILDSLHPGVERRLAALGERLADEEDTVSELADLALAHLLRNDGHLPRGQLTSLGRASQRRLLQTWLVKRTGRTLSATNLESLLPCLAAGAKSGSMDLAGGWCLQWRGDALTLVTTNSPPPVDEHRREQPGP